MSETVLVQAILRALGTSPLCRVWRQNTGRLPVPGSGHRCRECGSSTGRGQRYVSFGLPGAADISGILCDGRRLEIECKLPGRRQTEQQVNFQRMIERHHGVYILARSVDEAVRAVEEATHAASSSRSATGNGR